MEELEIGALELDAIIDVAAVRALLENLHKITGMPLAILDLKGKFLIAVGWQDICTHFHRLNPQTALNCTESDLYLSKHVHQGEFVAYKCKNQLWDMITPFSIGGRHIGNIYCGQFFYDDEPLDERTFIKQAEKFGFDRESYLDAVRHVPRVGREKVDEIMQFVARFAAMVSELNYGKLHLERTLSDQQRTTEVLQTSYNLLLTTMRDAFVSVDMQGHIKDCNEYYLNMVGYAPDEIRNLTYADLTPGKWHAMEAAIVERQVLTKGYSDIYEKEYCRKDGTVVPVELRTILLKDGHGDPTGMWAIVRDISERKQAEDELKSIKFAIDSATDAIGMATAQGHHFYQNKAFDRMFGLTVEEVARRHPIAAYKDKQAGKEVFEAIMSGKSWQGELEMIAKDGRCFPIFLRADAVKDAQGKVVSLIGVHTDISARKEAEEQLVQSEEQYRTLVDNMQDVIYRTDRNGNIVYISPSAPRLLGCNSSQEMIGLNIARDFYYHPEDRQKFLEALKKEGKVRNYEVTLKRRDNGNPVYVSTNSQFYYDKDGNILGVDGIFNDITERKQAEKALRESEERYRMLFENATEGIFLTTPAGRYISVNPSTARMFRYDSPKDMMDSVTDIGQQIYANPDDRVTVGRMLAEHGKFENFEVEMVRKDKSRIWITMNIHVVRDEQGNILYYDGTCVDITERKRAEELLRESEEKFRTIFDLTPVSVSITDLEGRYLDVNARLCERSKLGREEIIGRRPTDDPRLFRNASPEKEAELIQKFVQQGGKLDEEIQLVRPIDHEQLSVILSSRLVSIAGKDCVLSTVLDITERKRLEEQLIQAQKMETVGRLAGGVAHDFNNLLTAISGNVELALMDKNVSPGVTVHLKDVEKAAARAAELTRQLLAFSRKQIIEQKVIDLGSLIKDMEKMLARLIGEDISLQTFVRPGTHLVKVDPGQMHQIVMNLAVNARDAMPEGGLLTLETSTVVLDEAYCRLHDYATPGRNVVLAVSDTGSGMTEEVKKHLFEPFFTTKSLGKGTGLGLATVYGAVKQNSGTIEVYSEPGKGTCFKIYFPKVAGDREILSAPEGEKPMAGGTETILVVEDDPAVLGFSREMLTRLGYRVLTASNGEEAMRVAREHAGEIRLLMTDVVLPGMNGRQIAEKLAGQYPGLRVLFCSGYTGNTIVHHGVLEQHLNFIGKPFSMPALARKIRFILDAPD